MSRTRATLGPRRAKSTSMRFWLLCVLVAYAGQMLAVSAHAAQMLAPVNTSTNVDEQVSKSCHGAENQARESQVTDHNAMPQEIPANTSDLSSLALSADCCDDKDCSMLFCHATSATVSHFDVWHGVMSHALNAFLPSHASIAPHPNLFRPPILA